jgi:hypothetical protein
VCERDIEVHNNININNNNMSSPTDNEAPAFAEFDANASWSERFREVVVNYLPLSWITFGGPQVSVLASRVIGLEVCRDRAGRE